MKKNYVLLITLFITTVSFGQTTIFDVAGGGALPTGWSSSNPITSGDIDRSTYYLVETDGTDYDNITTDNIDLTSYSSAEFSLDLATFGSGTNNPAKIEISFDGGGSYTQVEVTATPSSSTYIDGGTFPLSSLTSQVKIRITNNGVAAKGVRLRNIKLVAYSASPTILVSSAVSGLDYEEGSGPSVEGSFTVSGTFLTDDILVSAPTNFEVSETPGGTFTNSVTLLEGGTGTIGSTLVYVRLKDALSVASYSDDITASSTSAPNKTVTVSGDVFAAPTNALLIAGVYDGEVSSHPKGVSLYVLQDIPDLSVFGVGAANNGGGTDGQEFTFPADPASEGDYIYIASTATDFNTFFGFDVDYTDGDMGINGDDAIELFEGGQVIDVFGDINQDGSGTAWDYLDGWAYRNTIGPSTTFVGAEWNYSGINELDNAVNSLCSTPFPTATYYTAVLKVERNQIQNFTVYPNPVKDGYLIISSASSELKTIKIYDVLGKQVLSATTQNNERVNVSNLNAGIYILKVEEAGKLATSKLIIQ